MIASARTAKLLTRYKSAIEQGSYDGPPGIDPLILPTRVFDDCLRLTVGEVPVELIQVNIHSVDATVLWLPAQRLLLCGDTITYVDEPQSFDAHLADLGRLRELAPDRILPNHGDPDVIAAGGYSRELIRATERYIHFLQRCRMDPTLRETSLKELISEPAAVGSVHYFEPYEAVHQENLETVLATR